MDEPTNILPKSAMALYVKLYCHKRGKGNNRQHNLIEATKSWVLLSKTDKQQFLNLFKEYNKKTRKRFASNLQNAQLYMKKKQVDTKRYPKNTNATINSNHDTNEHMETYNKSEQSDINIQNEDELLQNYDTVISSPKPTHPFTNMVQDVPRLISEPVPPTRSSMELFEIIKHNEESTKNMNWSDLTKLQKQRYQRALLNIKIDYIKQYIAYLEQLTPEQLFLYYKSQI